MEQNNLREYRCVCGKLLFKGSLSEGTVEIKCKSCRQILAFEGTRLFERPHSYEYGLATSTPGKTPEEKSKKRVSQGSAH